MDFVKILERSKRSELEIYPDFQTGEVTDLLCRGGSFYAVWDEEKQMWSTKENDVQRMIDNELWEYVEEIKSSRKYDGIINVKTLKSDSSGMWNRFKCYTKRFPDSDIQLDENLTFANTKCKKKDYVSKRLPYSLEEGDYSAWDEMIDRLYAPSEREKIEWGIGAIVSGDSKKIQKFFVLYGEPGTGKGTVIDIITKLFDGYYTTFNAKALGSNTNQFATEVFKTNPLVAIQTDGDLSRIEDNTTINTIVSHENMVINEKHKPQYMGRCNSFLIIGTNRPVKITDAKSGVIRRLIDIHPKNKINSPIPPKEYDALMSQIEFQLGAIAYHCLQVYRELGKNYYRNYIPHEMIMKTDVFYNFVEANLDIFEKQSDGMSLRQAYAMYKEYCEDSFVEYKLPRYKFREELKNYYDIFDEVTRIDGKFVRSWYSGFKKDKFEAPVLKKEEHPLSLVLDKSKSLLDDILADCPAQYAVDDGKGNEKPEIGWMHVETTLRDINTKKVHYVRIPKDHIVIDFDLKNENGEKDILKNLEAASKFPKTYAEFSKGGAGIHLHYIYDGDVSKLASVYADGIEIKVFRGKSALRRRLSKCNGLDISHLSVGALPLKEEKMIDINVLEDEKHLRNLINKSLRKQIHGATRPEIDMIKKALEDAYGSGISYDVSDMEHDILVFAMNSTHQSDYCVKTVAQMKFESPDVEREKRRKQEESKRASREDDESPIVFFDVEIYPPGIDSNGDVNEGLFLICWKLAGEDQPVRHLVNPKPIEVEELTKYKLIGFNNRDYDNHILYARIIGYSNEQLYDLSQRIIVEHARDAKFPEAFDISYSDVFDFSTKKQSLKKWEIELGISHIEMGVSWDEPAPKSMWDKIIEYCSNDVLATEAVFNHCKEDWKGRQILVELTGGKMNDKTNALTTRLIFGNDRHPRLIYTDLATGMRSDGTFDPTSKFEGYEYKQIEEDKTKAFHNMYRGVDLGRGGWVYSAPGIYSNVALLDVASLHPSSIIALNKLGEYTQRYADLKQARVYIKHKEYDKCKELFDGKFAKYLDNKDEAKALSKTLKLPLNSFYGISTATFPNPAKDPKDVNNIIALRGALFMKTLFDEVEARGFKVIHNKTDSVKIPNATLDIIRFVQDFAKKYGYEMEHEATYDRICLIDKAQYVAAYMTPERCQELYGYIPGDNADHFMEHDHPWTTTGDEFQRPYIFKTLFSGEPVEFDDLCVTNSVKEGAIYLDMNETLEDVTSYEKEWTRRLNNIAHPDKPMKLNPEYASMDDDDLQNYISRGHDYQFIGRVGRFYPIRPGAGGGVQLVYRKGKYDSVAGTKGYRWLEAEAVKELGKEGDLDILYHQKLADDAIDALEQFGSYERFIDVSKPYISEEKHEKKDDLPWYESVVPCGDGKYQSCIECPNCKDDICRRGYSIAVNTSATEGVGLK